MEEWVSVSNFAKKIGKSTTFIYGLIAKGKLEYKKFERGKYNGFIVKYPQKIE